MQTERRTDGWWIVGVPDCEDCGPYETKVEAEDDRRGMERYIKHGHKPGFLTCDSSAKK